MQDPKKQRNIVLHAIEACPPPFNKIHSDKLIAEEAPFAYHEAAIKYYMQELMLGCDDKALQAHLFKGLEDAFTKVQCLSLMYH